jgi:hypothetical protein
MLWGYLSINNQALALILVHHCRLQNMLNLEKAIRSAKVLQQGQERTCTVPLTESSELLDSSCNFPDNSGTKSSNRVEMLQNLQSTDFIHDHISQNVCTMNQLSG